jgi:DegV family protein with EDD domain
MSEIALITDSTCDIPQNYLQQYDIKVVPHTIVWGDTQYLDRVDIQPEEFYERIEAEKIIPTTAQATEIQFLHAYMDAISRGYKQIVVVTLSNRLSGAIQSARNAAKMVQIPVHVIDSLGVTMGLGWQVLAAARVREMGGTVQDILTKINDVRQSISLYVGMDTVEFVRRGGRIGDAVRLIGMMMNIKPVVRVSNIKGLVEEVGLARTYHKAIDLMYSKFFETMDLTRKLHIAVLHGNAFDEAERMVERIQAEFHPAEILTSITGPVLGINTGPRALALAGYMED